jgi:two-component system CheB/CheR fusion protein
LKTKDASEGVRAWVAGCASGEEAYTLAMLLYEYALTLPLRPVIQVFATDIDEQAIAVARQGVYPDTIALDVSLERLQRFFTAEPGAYRVPKELRDLVLFAPHNLLRDPPFSRLDLITCRNVLIYIDRRLQEQVLQLFHFTLQPGGLLLLGSSESTDAVPTLFLPLDKAERLFQRRLVPGAPTLRVPTLPLVGQPQRDAVVSLASRAALSSSIETLAAQAMAQYGPPAVVVNQDADIIHVARGAGRFLQVADGPPSPNLLKALHPELRLDVRRALYQALQDGKPVQTAPVRLQLGPDVRQVSISVQPLLEPAAVQGYALVLIFDMLDRGEGALGSTSDAEPLVRQLEEELQFTREQLRIATEQHDEAIEEHRASNEEL